MNFLWQCWAFRGVLLGFYQYTPARTHFISALKSRVLKFKFFAKNDGENWSRIFYFGIHQAPSELLLLSAKKSAQAGWIGLAG